MSPKIGVRSLGNEYLPWQVSSHLQAIYPQIFIFYFPMVHTCVERFPSISKVKFRKE